jgi:hypothetical protein
MFLVLVGCMSDAEFLSSPDLPEMSELKANALWVHEARFQADGPEFALDGLRLGEHPVVEFDDERVRIAVDVEDRIRLLLWVDRPSLVPGAWAPHTVTFGESSITYDGGAHTEDAGSQDEVWYWDEPVGEEAEVWFSNQPILAAPAGAPLADVQGDVQCGCDTTCWDTGRVTAGLVESREDYSLVTVRRGGVRVEGWVPTAELEWYEALVSVVDTEEWAPDSYTMHMDWNGAGYAWGPAVAPDPVFQGEELFDDRGALVGVVLEDTWLHLATDDAGRAVARFTEDAEGVFFLHR